MKQTVVFDFDGVIHSYKSGWRGASIIPDPPVPGIDKVSEDAQRCAVIALLAGSNGSSSQRKYSQNRHRMPRQINFCPMCGRSLYLPIPTTAESNN